MRKGQIKNHGYSLTVKLCRYSPQVLLSLPTSISECCCLSEKQFCTSPEHELESFDCVSLFFYLTFKYVWEKSHFIEMSETHIFKNAEMTSCLIYLCQKLKLSLVYISLQCCSGSFVKIFLMSHLFSCQDAVFVSILNCSLNLLKKALWHWSKKYQTGLSLLHGSDQNHVNFFCAKCKLLIQNNTVNKLTNINKMSGYSGQIILLLVYGQQQCINRSVSCL